MGYVGKVAVGSTTHLVGSTLYGTCDTAAATQTKVVTCANFDTLITGVTIHVKFTYGNSSTSDAKLNVNSTGAKNIVRENLCYVSSANTAQAPNSIVSFTYDGTNQVMNNGIPNERLYLTPSQPEGYMIGKMGFITGVINLTAAVSGSMGFITIGGPNFSVKGGSYGYIISVASDHTMYPIQAMGNEIVAVVNIPKGTYGICINFIVDTQNNSDMLW